MITQLNRAAFALLLTAGLTACDGGTATSSKEQQKRAEPASLPLVALGQTGSKDGVELTITDVATPTQVGSTGHGEKAELGETFVVVRYTMKNVGSKPLTFMDRPGLTLLDAGGNGYAVDNAASITATFMTEGLSGEASDLNPNVSAKAIEVWKVDKAAFDRATWKVRLDTPSKPLFALQ
ncbi:DUF4352 domain-containing protein [Sphingopyxis sp. J-6]|uniref:hypothetical protein n=1 Tax=Sphingopyxis sp. J-6 TaxID=3122054 RepID=UPI0039846173